MAIESGSSIFWILLIMTIIILMTKFSLILYLLKKTLEKKKKEGKFIFDILFCSLVLLASLFVSRILFMYFDFFLTEFDNSRFALMPNPLIWKIAASIVIFGTSFLIFNLDRKVFNFRFKGILAYAEIIIGIVLLFYPVNDLESFQNMQFISILGILFGAIIPLFFFYLAFKTPPGNDVRKLSLSMGIGITTYVIASVLVGEVIMEPIRLSMGDIGFLIIWIISLSMKIVGLAFFSYGSAKIKI